MTEPIKFTTHYQASVEQTTGCGRPVNDCITSDTSCEVDCNACRKTHIFKRLDALVVRPCPFCGRHPEVSERTASDGEGNGYLCFIACMCGGYSARAHQFGKGDNAAQAKARAFAAWNTRADAGTEPKDTTKHAYF